MKWWKLPLLLIIGIAIWAWVDPGFRAQLNEVLGAYLSFLMPDTTGGSNLSINPGIPETV